MKSHSILLLEEAFYKIDKYFKENDINNCPVFIDPKYNAKNTFIWRIINRFNSTIFKKIGFNITEYNWLNENTSKLTLFMSENYLNWLSSGVIVNTFCNYGKLDEVYYNLNDEKSKKTFDWFIKYKTVLGLTNLQIAEELFPYPTRNSLYYKKLEQKIISKLDINTYNVKGYKINSYLSLISATWVHRQYFLENVCEPKEGDIIIDAGSFRGESAIWFADIVGKSGKVFAFEPVEDNISILKNNINWNDLDDIISIVESGVWSENNNINVYNQSFSSICSDDGNNTDKVNVMSIDSFVNENNLNRVNIIKMDIEGSELMALKGAADTIVRFSPTLAICVYHKPDDIIEIPHYIKSLVPDYNIYLSHKYTGWSETILFASKK